MNYEDVCFSNYVEYFLEKVDNLFFSLLGYNRFSDNIFAMLGKRPTKYWEICWKFVSLLVIGVSLRLFVNKVMLSIRIDNEIQKNQYCN